MFVVRLPFPSFSIIITTSPSLRYLLARLLFLRLFLRNSSHQKHHDPPNTPQEFHAIFRAEQIVPFGALDRESVPWLLLRCVEVSVIIIGGGGGVAGVSVVGVGFGGKVFKVLVVNAGVEDGDVMV